MKIIITGGWNIETTPFLKIERIASSASRRTERVFLPITGGITEITDGNFIVRKTEKGYAISRGSDNTPRTLYFGAIADGFRGGSGIDGRSRATIIAQGSSSSACDGETVYAAIVKEGEPLVVYSRGRRTDIVRVISYCAENGILVQEMDSDEAALFFAPPTEEGEAI